MDLLVPILLFALGLVMLIKGGDWFVDGAVGIAKRFRIPDLLIGATVVSIGTTLPEVMVSASSAVKGIGGIAYGNAVGSVICNTALIAALTIAIAPALVDRRALRAPVLFFFAAAAVYVTVAYTTQNFSRFVGIGLLCLFVVYMAVTVWQMRRAPAEAETEVPEEGSAQEKPLWRDLLFLVIGAALIAFGANFLVDNGTIIAQKIGVPDSVIGLTFVALGTSLPELVTAITSLIKKHGSLSLGNIIGANLFNLVLVSGLSVTIAPFQLPAEQMLGGHILSLVVDLPVMLAVMVILTLPALLRGKTARWQGIFLLAVYAAFCTLQFIVA